MNNYQVIMPVSGELTIDERYDAALAFLDQRQAMIHMVAVVSDVPTVYDDMAQLHSHQAVGRLAEFAKYEALERMAKSIQHRFPGLQITSHVEAVPFSRTVARLRADFDPQFLIIDQRSLSGFLTREQNDAIQYLVTMTELPIWCVGPKATPTGDVMAAVDLPVDNPLVDQLNLNLIQTAVNLCSGPFHDVYLVNSWQLSSEKFMRQWLQLTDRDVARFSRSEKQQRETRLMEFLQDCRFGRLKIHIQVVEGAAELTLPNLSEELDIQLLIIGHSQNAYGPMGQTTADVLTRIECDALILPQTPVVSQSFLYDELGGGLPTGGQQAH